MSRLHEQRELAAAVRRTWGVRGIGRRVAYEGRKRSGLLVVAERRWATGTAAPTTALGRVGLGPPASLTPPDPARFAEGAGLVLYGGLAVDVAVPPEWHRQPLGGHTYDADAHWSALSDAAPELGDVKDVWELSRLGWLQPRLRHWAATGDDAEAEAIWRVVEDWHERNPPYLGPNWMCGQETSLRTIAVMALADALDASPATTDARRLLVARLVQDAVGRVAPTLGYALSQRNNHASSEGGFLWTAAVLAPWLPGADRLRRRAARALSEVVEDQFGADGSYAQHSPTYQRVALHVLLWCLAVARATGEPLPPGVADAVGRSVGHLRSLVAPGSAGRVPNLGGNDGALVFDLAPTSIDDLRPVIAHAAAATGQSSGFGPGPWDEEAAWFGLAPAAAARRPRSPSTVTHALTCGRAHAVLRAGPLVHRPAHADQLHVDVWLDGEAVAVDPGSFRYTAPAPWGNALAGEDVHNLARRPSSPQAVRAGRFFWRRWESAEVVASVDADDLVARVARLRLPDATVLHRLVAVTAGLVLVVDQADGTGAVGGAPVEVRWNLPEAATVRAEPGRTEAAAAGWQARFDHGGLAATPTAVDDDPASGWHAPRYGVRAPLTAIVLTAGPEGRVASVFATDDSAVRLDAVLTAAADLDLARVDAAGLRRVRSAGG